MYAAAESQRRYAEARLNEWPAARPARDIDVVVTTLACERDRLLVMRMLDSLLRRAGRPAEIQVISDGSLSPSTRSALLALDPSIHVCEFAEFARRQRLPDAVVTFAAAQPFGMKFGVLLTPVSDRPVLYVDSDVEFLRGARRLTEWVESFDDAPRYMADAISEVPLAGYDPRVIGDLDVLPSVNAGVCLFSRQPDWAPALRALQDVADSPTFLTEQTLVAITMTLEHGKPFPPDEFILRWEDAGRPWDLYSRTDRVLRHYASPILRWKMYLRGGARGLRTLPVAIAARIGARDR